MRTQTRVDFAKLLAGYAVKHQEISLTDWANYTRNDLLKLTGISVMEIKADSSDLNSFYQQVFKTVAKLEVTEYE